MMKKYHFLMILIIITIYFNSYEGKRKENNEYEKLFKKKDKLTIKKFLNKKYEKLLRKYNKLLKKFKKKEKKSKKIFKKCNVKTPTLDLKSKKEITFGNECNCKGFIYKPVCGDGVTYSNYCLAKCSNAKKIDKNPCKIKNC
jgi:hypothetical protein